MSRSVFVSCVHEDSQLINIMKAWEQRQLIGDITITSELEDKRNEGTLAVKRYLQKKIEGAAGIVVLVGNNTHNHDWIAVEVELANSFHKKIVCMRIPNTTGAQPSILARYKIVSFDPMSLKNEF